MRWFRSRRTSIMRRTREAGPGPTAMASRRLFRTLSASPDSAAGGGSNMGTMSFLLPSAAPASALADLDRACVAGGYDNMPAPTHVVRDASRLKLLRDVDESGYLVVPWEVPDVGRLMGSSATLIERSAPYQFAASLAPS